MFRWIISNLGLETSSATDMEYLECVYELINHEMVKSMENYIQHSDIDCLEHSLYVSYNSYLVCKRMGLDYRSAARGGLLHDFFLYDWHRENPCRGLHGLMHPRIALQNANKYFELNELEQDIIRNHMWPLTITLSKHRETYIVVAIDKYCATMETFSLGKINNPHGLKRLLSY